MSNLKQLKNYIRKLRVSSNSIIMILSKGEDDKDSIQLAQTLQEAVNQLSLNNIIVILLDDFNRIAVLELQQMNKAGWFRREQIESLFRKISTRKPELEKVANQESEKKDD